jgi:hypothetical protein
MPAQDRLGLHEQQGRAPRLPHLGEQDPEEPISWPELRPGPGPRQYGQLLAQRQVLKGNCAVAATYQSDGSKQYDKCREHPPSCREFGQWIKQAGPAIVLWRTTPERELTILSSSPSFTPWRHHVHRPRSIECCQVTTDVGD